MNTLIDKRKYILENGWIPNDMGKFSHVSWKTESERLGIESHLCPHWYHPGYTLDEAFYAILTEQNKINSATKSVTTFFTRELIDYFEFKLRQIGVGETVEHVQINGFLEKLNKL